MIFKWCWKCFRVTAWTKVGAVTTRMGQLSGHDRYQCSSCEKALTFRKEGDPLPSTRIQAHRDDR